MADDGLAGGARTSAGRRVLAGMALGGLLVSQQPARADAAAADRLLEGPWIGAAGEHPVALGGGAPAAGARRPAPRALQRVPDERRADRVPLGGPSGARRRACERRPGDERRGLGARSTERTSRNAGGPGARRSPPARRGSSTPTRAALRLVVDRTNAGPPARARGAGDRERARRPARRQGQRRRRAGPASPRPAPSTAATRAAGRARPARSRWTLRVDLPRAAAHRSRAPRARVRRDERPASGVRPQLRGRLGAGSLHARGERGRQAVRRRSRASRSARDGSILPLRRRLVTLARAADGPRAASGHDGRDRGQRAARGGRGARRARDRGVPRRRPPPVLASPWILSVNANPSAETAPACAGGEWPTTPTRRSSCQRRFAPAAARAAPRRSLRAARSGLRGEPLDAPPTRRRRRGARVDRGRRSAARRAAAGAEQPPAHRGPQRLERLGLRVGDRARPRHARSAGTGTRSATPSAGGMGQLAPAVRGASRRSSASAAAPRSWRCSRPGAPKRRSAGRRTGGSSIGCCGARAGSPSEASRRPSTSSARGRATRTRRARRSSFRPSDPLFADLAGPLRRSTTQSLPESHADAVRPDAFLPGGPLQRFEVLATSAFCAPDVVAAGPRDGVVPNPSGAGWCDTVPEAFRIEGLAWPIIGAQFHAEQRDLPGPGRPARVGRRSPPLPRRGLRADGRRVREAGTLGAVLSLGQPTSSRRSD